MPLNINIGILGHVDSGKTSLAKCLSQIASTASFDKNPQSQERGITLDLGFSSFSLPAPTHLKNGTEIDEIQYTLVDCPGHASLIKTIIGGAQIIDMMLLVIDVTKGIQTQTAECLIIGEITCKKMIIALNKVDLLESDKKDTFIEKMKSKIRKTLSSTAFGGCEVPIVGVSANNENPSGVSELLSSISNFTFLPERNHEGPFLFAIDHCFGIRGQGTVMTGTVLKGCVSINDTINIPQLSLSRKVKSMQMFKKPVEKAVQGDRLGLCITQLDPKLLERGVACSPGYGNMITLAIIKLNPVKYYKQPIQSKSKLHISIGYETTLAQITLFYSKEAFDVNCEYEYKDVVAEENSDNYYALLEFEKPVFAVENSLIVASKLDTDIHKNACRLAFWGNLLVSSVDKERFLSSLKLYKTKVKIGNIDRVANEHEVIVKNMFKKETDLQKFVNLNVEFSTGEVGSIEGSFGKSGKVKVYVRDGFKSGLGGEGKIEVKLKFKKFIFDSNKTLKQ